MFQQIENLVRIKLQQLQITQNQGADEYDAIVNVSIQLKIAHRP